MLDHIRLSIPVFATYVKSIDNRHYFNGDMLDYGLNCATRRVSRDDDGLLLIGAIYSPFESLPSDFTDMACKFYHDCTNTLPRIELKASPAKLLQGHNVYGFDDILLGATEMLGLLTEAYPKLCAILDFANAEVMHLDFTYSARLPHQNMVQPVLDYLANVQAGHRKSRGLKYQNYIAFSESSRYINAKVYGKYIEVQDQIKDLQKQVKKGDIRASQLVAKMHQVLPFANALLRFEARIQKTYLTKNNYPTNLWQLINYQQQHPTLAQDLWRKTFDGILNNLKGDIKMIFKQDDEVEEYLKSKLFSVTKKGNITYTKAYNAMGFYRSLRDKGYQKHLDDLKKCGGEKTFYNQLNALLQAGFSKAELQNLHIHKNGKVIPFVRLVEIKFDEQLPPDYIKPTSKYTNLLNVA